jgi:ubiquinone biosynthesis protein
MAGALPLEPGAGTRFYQQAQGEGGTFNETLLVATSQKIATLITLGLILAAPILGASLLMRVGTAFRILGSPGLAMILFFLAILGALALVI